MKSKWIAVLVCATSACSGGATPRPPATATERTSPGPEPAPIERGQNPPRGPYAPGFDVQHYDIELDVTNAAADPPTITGTTTIDVRIVEPDVDSLRLDFTGLRVLRVAVRAGDDAWQDAGYRHADGRLAVAVPRAAAAAGSMRVRVDYDGTPDDGLIIRDNVHGERTAFVDNWPNRARFWFPSIDHPSDKASLSIAVRVPVGWQVVANGPRVARVTDGLRASDTTPADGVWRFRIDEPIPTYTMVFGAAEFVVDTVDACADGRHGRAGPECVVVTSWVFPPDTAAGARNFRRAGRMIEVFSELIAPFPYEKLAHVQSATEFGGMENAGATFYSEQALARGADIEGTVAHEVAHQWFGDAVTEADWQHLWLSEGFATYLDALFYEREDGVDVFRRKMAANAAAYLGSNVTDLPLVDTTASLLPDLFALLNQNSYQKGAWVLHMLRGRLGDDAFFAGIRDYYATHEHGTALSADLQAALERASGTDLDAFFDQWVYGPGHPILRASHEYRDGRLRITIEQTQKTTWPTFTGPITVEIVTPSGTLRETVQLTGRTSIAERPLDAAPTALHLDPDGWLLHEVAP